MIKTDDTLLFIHIPKTAGSSFRKAAEAYFGSQNTFYDYGPKAKETHPDILKYEYQKKDRFLAGKAILQKARLLSGHIPYGKYAPFIHPKNIITFVRSPEQQIRSHFEHYVRHHGYKESFQFFIQEKRFSNLQSRNLQGINPEAIGFIGLTEQYDSSVTLINKLFDLNLKTLNVNQNQQKKASAYTFEKSDLALIHKHNSLDFELYEYALKRFVKQKQAVENNTPFIRFGNLPLPPKQAKIKFNGWVTCYENEDAQSFDVIINNIKIDRVTANEYRGQLNERNLNRAGYIGFTWQLPKQLKAGDDIRFIETNTQTELHRFTFE